MDATFWIEIAGAVAAFAVILMAGWVEIAASPVSRLSLRQFLDERYLKSSNDDIDEGQRVRFAMLVVQAVGISVATGLLVDAFNRTELEFGVVIGTIVAIVVGVIAARVAPRALAGEDSTPGSPRALRVGRWMRWIFSPLVLPAEWIGRVLGGDRKAANGDEVSAVVMTNGDASSENGEGGNSSEVDEDDFHMISGVLHLVDSSADDIMVPRLDLIAMPVTSTIGEAVSVAIEGGHSRIPVYGENIDEIIGIVYAKDLLKYVTQDKAHETIEAEIRPAYFVPESKKIDELLQELQQERVHMAIVVDEYGGTAGVVTIEDILEEIVGEIVDEYDQELPQIETISADEILVDGRILVEEALERLDIPRDERPEGTVAGLIQRELGRIPRVGDTVEVDGAAYCVESVERRRVRQVRVSRIVADAESDEVVEHAGRTSQ